MAKQRTEVDTAGVTAEAVLKAAVAVGAIALGLLALKYLLGAEDDED